MIPVSPMYAVHLEDHLMRPVALSQAEVGAQVCVELRLLLDSGQQCLVHLLLVLSTLTSNRLLLWLLTRGLLEERLLAALLVRLLVTSKVALAGDLVHGRVVEAVEGDAGLGCDHVAGVDAAEWDTVDLEGTGNDEGALLSDLEEDHTLASETASEEDKDSARLEGCARLVWVLGLAGLFISMSAPILPMNTFSNI